MSASIDKCSGRTKDGNYRFNWRGLEMNRFQVSVIHRGYSTHTKHSSSNTLRDSKREIYTLTYTLHQMGCEFQGFLLQLLRWHVYVVGLLLLRGRKSIRAYTYISKCFFFLSFFLSYLTLSSFQSLKITERIEYKLLSLTYKVLTTTDPLYLHNLISVQIPRPL